MAEGGEVNPMAMSMGMGRSGQMRQQNRPQQGQGMGRPMAGMPPPMPQPYGGQGGMTNMPPLMPQPYGGQGGMTNMPPPMPQPYGVTDLYGFAQQQQEMERLYQLEGQRQPPMGNQRPSPMGSPQLDSGYGNGQPYPMGGQQQPYGGQGGMRPQSQVRPSGPGTEMQRMSGMPSQMGNQMGAPMPSPMQQPYGGQSGLATGMSGGIGSLAQGNMGASPRLMAKGGIVQHFQNGSVGEDGVTQVDESSGITYSPEMMDAFRQRILSMAGRDAMRIPDLMQRTQELAPQYRTLLGVDPSATKSQMLFDVAQAALNYAGNVNAQGQPMRGSQAARLAGAASGLPAAIGARAADAQKQNQAIRMAAMQGAQSEIDAARATNTSREDALDKMAIEAMKQKVSARPMTPAEKTAYGISGPDASLPWVIDQTGKVTIAGGRPSVPLVNMGESKLGDRANFLAADELKASYTAANSAMSTLNNINQIRPILNDKESVFSGPISGAQVFVSRLANSIGVGGKTSQETLNNTVATMQNLALFELDAAAAMRGQGAITENERALIKRASAGNLATMTQDEVIELVSGLEKQANYRISQHNARLNNFENVYADDPNTLQSLKLFRLTDVPVMSAFPASTQTPTTAPPLSSNVTITPDALAAEIARRRAAGQ